MAGRPQVALDPRRSYRGRMVDDCPCPVRRPGGFAGLGLGLGLRRRACGGVCRMAREPYSLAHRYLSMLLLGRHAGQRCASLTFPTGPAYLYPRSSAEGWPWRPAMGRAPGRASAAHLGSRRGASASAGAIRRRGPKRRYPWPLGSGNATEPPWKPRKGVGFDTRP